MQKALLDNYQAPSLTNMKKIDLTKIRGRWIEDDGRGNAAGGDDTTASMRLIAEKVNELIDLLARTDVTKN